MLILHKYIINILIVKIFYFPFVSITYKSDSVFKHVVDTLEQETTPPSTAQT